MNSKKLVMHRFLKGYEIEVRVDIRDLEPDGFVSRKPYRDLETLRDEQSFREGQAKLER